VKVIVKSAEAIIVTAVYFFWAAGLISVGIVQLPLEKPECAAPSDSIVSFKAWGEVPINRYEAVWCDMGALAGVGVGFLGFCNFSFIAAMLFNKMIKQDHEAELLSKGLKQKKEAIVLAERRSTVRQSVMRQSQMAGLPVDIGLPGTPNGRQSSKLGLPAITNGRSSSKLGSSMGSMRGATPSSLGSKRGSTATLALPDISEAGTADTEETKPKTNHRYRAADHAKKEPVPLSVYEDYDGRLFDI
jgi:hypothetical protein